jgi:acyl-ACP thioesterase
MSDLPATHTDYYEVRAYEVGPDNLATPATLANYLQETAGHHASRLHLGPEHLIPKGIFWVMSRIRIKLHARPESQQKVELLTWPSALERHVAYRDFKLMEGETLLAEATTAWLVFDLEERKMIEIPLWIGENLPKTPDRNLDFERRTLPRLREVAHEQKILARRSDEDMLGHVNNAHFLEWVLESPPEVWLKNKHLVDIDIQFRSECNAGDVVLSRSADVQDEPGALLHSLLRESDGAELARAYTRWEDDAERDAR